MCWVMPPASPAATSVSRIASSSEVLPWSTWPMIVTTGGRSTRSASSSSNSGSSSTSSAAWTISIFFSNSSARTPTASSESVWVSVAISPSPISFLMISGTGTPRYSATSLTVEPELMRIVWSSGTATSRSPCASKRARPRRRPPPPRRRPRGGCWTGGPPGWRREAWESMTTRRRAAAAATAGARSPDSELRVGRWRPSPGGRSPSGCAGEPSFAPRRPGRSRRPGGPRRRHRRRWAPEPRRAVATVDDAQRGRLVDRRGGGADLEAGVAQLAEQVLGGHAVLLRDLVDALLGHDG